MNVFSFLPVQFSRCAGLSPGPICYRHSCPAGSAIQRPPVGLGMFSHLGLRSRFHEPSKRYRKDLLASLSFRLLYSQYIYRSYELLFLFPSPLSLRLRSFLPFRRSQNRPISFFRLSSSDSLDLGFELPSSVRSLLPRKEVIQPHLPIRLPCYDFTPVIGLTFGS